MKIIHHIWKACESTCRAVWNGVYDASIGLCGMRAHHDAVLETDRLRDVAELLSEALDEPPVLVLRSLQSVRDGQPPDALLKPVVKVETGFVRQGYCRVHYVVRALVFARGQAVLYESSRSLSWLAVPSDVRRHLYAQPWGSTCYRIL